MDDVSVIKAIVMTMCIVGFTGVAAYVDWRTKKLPNWLTVPCFATALVFHFVAGFFGDQGGILTAFTQLGWSLVGFMTGFGILFVMYLAGWGGGGDVKMMGAMGAWMMPQLTLYVFIISAVLTVLMYFRQIVNGEAAKAKKAIATAKRTNTKPKIKRHHAHYALRAGLAVWMVLGYCIWMMPQQGFPLFPAPQNIADSTQGSRRVADEKPRTNLDESNSSNAT